MANVIIKLKGNSTIHMNSRSNQYFYNKNQLFAWPQVVMLLAKTSNV